MLSLPVSLDTFKRSFLSGDGQLEIHTEKDIWGALVASKAPFPPSVSTVADLKLQLGTSKALTLGSAGTLKIGLSGSAQVVNQVQLIWPDSTVEPGTSHGLTPAKGELLIRLLLHGQADAKASGSAPIGPLHATFGVTAGGSLTYELLQIRPADTPAWQVLGDLFAGLRLPQQVIDGVPAKGEVISTRLAGYLTVKGQVNYGYSMTGSRDIQIGKLNLDLSYALRLAAGLTAAYKIAGEFDLEARAGSSDGYIRYIVRKSRDSQFNFAADFGAEASVHLQGLPNTADEFLVKAFGASAETAIQIFGKARQFTDVNQLEQAVGKLLNGAVHEWSVKLIGQALSDATLNQFVTKALAVVDAYNNLDQKIIHLYEDILGKAPELKAALDKLAGVTSRDGLKNLVGQDAWDLITRFTGPGVYDILVDDAAFGEFAKLVQQAKSFLEDGGAQQDIREFVKTFKDQFPLDSVLAQLKGITTPDQLKNLADQKLQGLAERLLGKAFDEIRKDAGKQLQQLHAALDKVNDFKDSYYKKLVEVTNRSYAANVHLEFARASTSDKLLDVEIDVRTDEGKQLAVAAGGGDFAAVLAGYRSTIVRINKGLFTHSTSHSTHIQVNLLGYGAEGFTEMLQRTDEAIEAHEGGLLHIYTTKTSIDQRKKNGGELTASTFLLATVASALQPGGSRDFPIQTLPRMSAQYDLLEKDNKTSPDEMRQILDLATLVGSLTDREAFLNQLRTEFPRGLGEVSAKYVIRYNSDAVPFAFLRPAEEKALRAFVTESMRAVIASRYIGMRPVDWAAPFGFAYASPDTFELYDRLGFATFKNTHITVTLPGWFAHGAPQKVELRPETKEALIAVYSIEKTFADRFVKLDALIDKLRNKGFVKPDDLNDHVAAFVDMAPDLDDFRTNAFFAVFDRLVMEGSNGRAPRESALVLEITPTGGQKVTKVLTAAAQSAESVEEEAAAKAALAGD
jgi:hypothetical protein